VRREMFEHSHVQLVVCQVSTGVDDGASVVVNDQELIGLHRLSVFFNKFAEHVAGMMFIAAEFEGLCKRGNFTVCHVKLI